MGKKMIEEIIATNVIVQIILHPGLTFKNESNLKNRNILIKTLGTVVAGTQLTFEYELKKEEELLNLDIDFKKLEGFPF